MPCGGVQVMAQLQVDTERRLDALHEQVGAGGEEVWRVSNLFQAIISNPR